MKKLLISISRNPKLFGMSLFFGLTTIWALLEPFVSIYFENINKYWFLLIFLFPSIIIAFIRIFPKNSIIIKLRNTNAIINVKFGDIFNENGNIAIAVNEYFDSEIGDLVSPESVHGYFIKGILGNKQELFDSAVDKSLKGISSIHHMRNFGKQEIYPIGTTAVLEFGEKRYLLFALAKTNEQYEAYTTPSLLLEALNGMLIKARSECNGYPLNIPLVGTGLSRSGIPPKYIIELLLISILRVSKEAEITKEINIVIAKKLFDEIDLNEIVKRWN
jgi:hypothetical protein